MIPKYRRVLLKLSGESLKEAGSSESISPRSVQCVAEAIGKIVAMNVQVAVVVGGGNIWRGVAASHAGMNRTTADYMGMLATVINGMALMSTLETLGYSTRVQTAIQMNNIAEPFILRRAIHHLERGRILIFVAGTGNTFFSTDTTAALRASEIEAEIILKGTKVDGIYDSDPHKNPDASRFTHLTYRQALTQRLAVMDSTAFSLCMDNRMPIIVFNIANPQNLLNVVLGHPVGTLVTD